MPVNPGLMRDLLLLGKMFIADKLQRQKIPSLKALTFLYAYQRLGVIDKRQNYALREDGASIQKVLDVSYVLHLDQVKTPLEPKLRRLALTRDEHLILQLPAGESTVDRKRVLGARGYLLRITDAGLQYADEIEPAYASRVNPVSFSDAWQAARLQLRAAHNRMRKAERQKPQHSGRQSNSQTEIPRSGVSEKDWMWGSDEEG